MNKSSPKELCTDSGKLEFLDGIRGLMAFNVVLCHFVCVYYPQMYYPEYAESMGGFLSLFSTTPLSILINGNIAVQYFFVLTGFLVGRSFFTKNISVQSIANRSIQRYLRLLPMIFVATVFTFLTMRFGLQYHLRITDLVHNRYFLGNYCNFTERLINLPENIFINPFFQDGSLFIGPFWTIRYELWGYIFAMILCVIFREQKHRYLEYLLVWFLLKKAGLSNYNAFLLGVVVADIRYNTAPSALKNTSVRPGTRKATRLVISVLGLYFASCPIFFTGIHRGLGTILHIGTNTVRALGIAMLLFIVLDAPKVQKLCAHPLLLWLGDRSFEVYAFHWPLMLSFQSWAFYCLSERFSYDIAAVAAFLATLPLIYLTSHLVHCLLAKGNLLLTRYKSKS